MPCPYSIEVEERILAIEVSMVNNWNGMGEPWYVIDPETGGIIAEGLGILALRGAGDISEDVTVLFKDLNPLELGLKDIADIKKSWLEKHATYGDQGVLFTNETTTRLNRILDAWENTAKGTESTLYLCHEANVESQVGSSDLNGKVVTHYHPNNKRLTKHDRKAFRKWGLLELRAVTKEDLFIMRRRSPDA